MLDVQHSVVVFKVNILVAVWSFYAPTYASKLPAHLSAVPKSPTYLASSR